MQKMRLNDIRQLIFDKYKVLDVIAKIRKLNLFQLKTSFSSILNFNVSSFKLRWRNNYNVQL